MAVGLVDKLDTATLLRAATVMRDRRHISNHVDTNTQSGESTNRRFATRTWALDFNIQILDALFNSGTTGNFRSHLSGKWSGLARTFEALATRRCPRQRVTLTVCNCNDGVIERRMYVCNTISNVLANFFAYTLGGVIGGGFCPINLSMPVISSAHSSV